MILAQVQGPCNFASQDLEGELLAGVSTATIETESGECHLARPCLSPTQMLDIAFEP